MHALMDGRQGCPDSSKIIDDVSFGPGPDNHDKRVMAEFAKTLMNVELQILIVILMPNVSIKKVFMNVNVIQVRVTCTVCGSFYNQMKVKDVAMLP